MPLRGERGLRRVPDESLRRFDVVYLACGSSNSAIALAPDELAACTPGSTWVDVCKLPEEAVA